MSVVQVSVAPLIAALRPEPPRCLATIHALVPRLANRKHEAFMSMVAAASARLAQTPETLAELPAYVEYIAEVGAQKPVLERAFEDVQAHYALCKVHTVHCCFPGR